MASSKPTLTTITGREVDPWNLTTADIDIVDIAHALSNICRFNGHSLFHYSVAQHSINVSMAAPLGFELHGLLHDAAEAYFYDLPTPIKHAPGMERYRDAEHQAQKLIFWRFGLDMANCPDLKPADNFVYEIEERALVKGEPNLITPCTPQKIEEAFLTRFDNLFKNYHIKSR